MIFEQPFRVHFDEADPAGIAFSGVVFTKVHRVYEAFIEHLGQNPKSFFLNPEIIYPLRHMEAEYFGPLFPLENYVARVGVSKLSESSFSLEFTIGAGSDRPLCIVRSTHVCCLKEGMQKSSIPEDLRSNLQKFVIQQ